MTTAACLLVYGGLVTWLSPPLLSKLTRRGLNPRLGVAAWLTAIVGVLLAWAAAVALIVLKSISALPDSAVLVVCLEFLGVPARQASPGRFTLLVLIGAGVLVSTLVTVQISRSVAGLVSRSREHAHAARLIGAPTDRPDVVVVPAERPAAYCVVGRPNAIVVTTGALATLDAAQLAAVLAHEDAHIAGRHHHLLMALRAIAVTLRLPLFTRGAVAVAELLEMCADDAAARRHGSRPLVAGMIKLAGPLPASAGGLAVAANAVLARVNRLLDPACRSALWCHQLLAWATIAVIAGAPIVINVLCRH
jgi:Zn-dependent protease with chaperone function